MAIRAMEEEEAERERKRKRMAFDYKSNVQALTEQLNSMAKTQEQNSNKAKKAKMSGPAYPKTCAICSYHEPNLTKEGDKYYKVVHNVDKVPFDCCSFCLSEIEDVQGYKVLRCLNELIPV